MTWRRLAAALVAVCAAAGCAAETPDYQSIWTDSPTAATPPPATTAETPVPFYDYLEGVGVTGEPVAVGALKDVTVTLPVPAGWAKVNDPQLRDVELLRPKGSQDHYPNVMVMAFKLWGGFDVNAAITHANADAMMSPRFTKLGESFTDFKGFPSAMIEGSYDGPDGRRVHTYNRVVIPVTSTFDRYLIQFTASTLADQAVAQSDPIEASIRGFAVAVK
ncbi:LpqN/LpqT family lipoprotein [Mycolicibacterium mengxianglii]|uniref:LpqN/LpqT family lipoprotein n=1 Tax=Mycolicibacterium mengxianglii TaxID=2736649 RepID=UPI0027DA9A06|nr:LpqN/LpqT family lipoprotein [Mycolicibacterium mengxianglii]